jgi:hypothetical protein
MTAKSTPLSALIWHRKEQFDSGAVLSRCHPEQCRAGLGITALAVSAIVLDCRRVRSAAWVDCF